MSHHLPQCLFPLPLSVLPLNPLSPSLFCLKSDPYISTISPVLNHHHPHFTCRTKQSKHSTPSSLNTSFPTPTSSSASWRSASYCPLHKKTFVSQTSPPTLLIQSPIFLPISSTFKVIAIPRALPQLPLALLPSTSRSALHSPLLEHHPLFFPHYPYRSDLDALPT